VYKKTRFARITIKNYQILEKTMSQAKLKVIENNTMDKENRSKSLEAAVSLIEKNYGKGSIMKLGSKANVDIESISTGSLGLDIALGIGGVPKGRIVEIYGPESSGKTTLATHIVAESQKKGGNCAFIDAEHALDPAYAKKLGVNLEELLISQPDTGEQGLEIADSLIKSGGIDVLVIDSVAALVPRAELEGDMGDSLPGLQARLMSQALRKLTSSIAQSNTLVVFINQLRMKIGVMFGSPETTTGGNALKFYSSVRMDIRRIGAIKDKDEIVGNQTRVKIVKNKVAPPFKVVEFDIMYGEGISKLGELVDLGVKAEIIDNKWVIHLQDGKKIESKVLINASGPWINETLKKNIKLKSKNKIRLVKGSHIITKKLYKEDVAFTFQNKDKRIIFVIPYKKKLL
jgi:recombination protein RecA